MQKCLYLGTSAEDFISHRKMTGSYSRERHHRSKHDILRDAAAQWLHANAQDVDIFSLMNHASLPRTLDVRYSVRSDAGYHRPVRLNGLVLAAKEEVSFNNLFMIKLTFYI